MAGEKVEKETEPSSGLPQHTCTSAPMLIIFFFFQIKQKKSLLKEGLKTDSVMWSRRNFCKVSARGYTDCAPYILMNTVSFKKLVLGTAREFKNFK